MTPSITSSHARPAPSMSGWRSWLRRCWPLLMLAVAAAWLHRGELRGERYYFRDTSRLYAPAKFYLAQLLREGILPQWWPWDGAGAPMLAQPIFSTFHPSTLLYVLLPFWSAFAAQDLAGTLLALGGTYLLARALKQPRQAAVVAAIFFAANGYVMGLTEHQFMKLSAGTMPWYWWSLIEAERRGRGWWAAPVAAMGLLLLAGDPQVALLAAGGGAVVLLARRVSWRRFWLVSLAPVLVAAVQLLPSLLLAPETERALPLVSRDEGPFDLAHAAGLVVPVQAGGFAPNVIVGLAGVALVGASLVALRRRRVVLALWMLLLISVWLALGDRFGLNPATRLLVPLWGKFRYPIKSLALGMLAAAVLAGEGVAQLGHRRRQGTARRCGLVLAGAVLLIAVLFFGAIPGGLGAVRGALLASVLPAIIVLGAARFRLRFTMIGIAAAQLLWLGGKVLPTVDASFYAEPPLAAALRGRGVGLLGPAFERIDGAKYEPEQTPMHIAAVGGGGSSAYGAFFHLPTVSFYTPGASLRLETVVRHDFSLSELGRLLGLYGVGYVVESPDIVSADGIAAVGGGTPIATDERYGDQIVPLRRSLARAYGVHRARSVANADVARTELLSSTFKPGREVLIEASSVPAEWSSRLDQLSIPAKITSRSNTSVNLEADLPWPGFLVLNESYFRGWTATVDREPAPVLVANGFVRAVEVASGHHQVSFRFQTPGLTAGAAISLGSWLALALAWLLVRRRRFFRGL
jgi:hypothetical protein